MVSLALKFGQLIHPSLGMKISTVKHLDTVQCFHPFTDELKVNGKAKGLEFYLRFFLFGCKTTGLSFEASDEPGKDPGNHLYQENPRVILLLLGYPFKNRMTKTGLNQISVI